MDTNDQKQTAKQRVIQAQGKDVALDLFLYSCLERERLVKAKTGTGMEEIRWPELTPDASGKAAVERDDMALSGLISKMAAWYRTQFPDMAGRGAMDHRQLVQVVPPVVALNMDIDALYRRKTGEELPAYEASVGNNKFWDDVMRVVTEAFPAYQRFFLRYIQWSHATEPVEIVDPSNRPPVGRYAPRLPRPTDRDRNDRGPRGGGGGFGGGGDRPPRPEGRGDRPDRPPRSEGRDDRPPREAAEKPHIESHMDRNDRPPPRSQQGDRPPRGEGRGDRPPRGEGRGDGPSRGRGRGEGRGEGRGGDEQTAKMSDAAMQEVDRAIDQLRTDTALDEVTLKPQNSFYRRIQHQKAIDSGFHSFSVGEGNERSVKVARKD